MLTYAAAMFVAWLLLRMITGIRLDYILGLSVYGVILVLNRLGRTGKRFGKVVFRRNPKRVRREVEPLTRVTQLEGRYRLKPFEVVLGFAGLKPIRADFYTHHTLIGGASGWGKSNILNSVLVQLFNKGPKFTNVCDVYLIDLKGDETDKFHLFQPVLAGYYSISQGPEATRHVIRALNQIVEDMHRRHKQGDTQKRILVFIDEIAMLTNMNDDSRLRGEATSALNRLSGQLRSRGTIVSATQFPKYDALPTSTRFNMDRRVCLYVNAVSEGQIILGTKPKQDELPTQKGEFLLREPGKAGLIRGQAMLVDIPSEIDRVVYKIIDASAENDERLRWFKTVAQGVEVCKPVVGINAIYKALGSTVAEVTLAYRHFAIAGAFEPPEKRGQSSKMKVPYEEGFGLVKKYIEEGNWHSTPESLREDVGEK